MDLFFLASFSLAEERMIFQRKLFLIAFPLRNNMQCPIFEDSAKFQKMVISSEYY